MNVLQQVFRVLDGDRVPESEGAAKLLYFILHDPTGCDGLIDARYFDIYFGWHPARQRYYGSLAAPVLGQLLTWAGARARAERIREILEPRTLHAPNDLEWSHGRRFLWIDREEAAVRFYVRGAPEEAADVPDEIPPSVCSEPRFVLFPKLLECRRSPGSC